MIALWWTLFALNIIHILKVEEVGGKLQLVFLTQSRDGRKWTELETDFLDEFQYFSDVNWILVNIFVGVAGGEKTVACF